MTLNIDERLQAVASFVRPNAVLADVGSDHAFLPIYLMLQNKIRFAIASDIHEGPIQSAKKNIASYGLSDRIATAKTNGLHGLESYHPTDIVIAGMGGELIATILKEASFLQDPKLRLILQPMSKSDKLRRFLWKNGFYIENEGIVSDRTKMYRILVVHYDGESRVFPDWYAYAGDPYLLKSHPLYLRCLTHLKKVFTAQLNGLQRAEQNKTTQAEIYRIKTLIFEIEEWLKS